MPAALRAFDRAVDLMKANDFASAEAILEAALDRAPNDPNLLRLLGVSLTRQNHNAEAEKTLSRVVRLVPNFALAHENLADALMQQGRLDEAAASLKTAIRHNPASDAANRKLIEVLALTGHGGEADEAFRHSLEADPDRAAIVEAMELNRTGETRKTEKILRDILRRNPEHLDALRLMGVHCARKELYNDAEAFFRRAVDLAPDFWLAWINLGAALNEQQKFDEADTAYKQALKLKPQSVFTLEKLGANSLFDGRHEDAVNWLDAALERDPAHFPSLLCLGHVLKTVGRQTEAIDAYRRCAAARPDFGEAYWSLANLKTFRFSGAEVREMEEHLEAVSGKADGEDSEIAFSFALAKAFEDRRNYGKAFDYYSRGNGRKRPTLNYDPIEFQRTNDRIIDVFTKEFFEARAGQGCGDDSPVLIVGLPRSGSTLLEQILASHSQVEGTAELHYLLRLATETGMTRSDGVRYPECMLEMKSHHFRDLGREYIENTERHRSGARYFTDKMPNNFTGIGFLQAILPNAKVIDARRHPLDSCLGSFKQLFARGQIFTYDLYDLAHCYIQYMRLMDHWNAVLPGKVLTVHYEDVVGDLEKQAGRIAAHCGLEWEEKMLRYHETERAVKTASSEQVRQPIYSGSVNLWRRYEDELGELIDYLEPVLLKLPPHQRPKSLMNR
ncbi:MAG: sulfotransferase [Gammaproteobacteria bacterium]|nr:sulfotransferase [Gammaproteobacteria bacterium]MDE0366904.1 sulfotransferase [Gammaproteobacteria bacterium]